jgi:hypothetical protein
LIKQDSRAIDDDGSADWPDIECRKLMYRNMQRSNPRYGRSARMLIAGILALFIVEIPSYPVAAAVPSHLLRYRATHSLYGEIGTYANRIVQQGEAVTVNTEIHLLVSILGIVLHREDAEREEQWRGDRLIAFRGITTVNGEAVEIHGDARESGFEVTSPQGTVLAPATVRPSNPWSSLFLGSDTLMRTDSGVIEHVLISPPTNAVLKLQGTAVDTQEYEIHSSPAYKVWLDKYDIPVMFTVDDDSGLVTFTLTEHS